MKKINFNSIVKVKLTDFGKDIYYHKNDELILRGFKNITPKMPKEDAGGYTSFALHEFMKLYGTYLYPDCSKGNVVEDNMYEPLYTLINRKNPSFNLWRSKFGYFEAFPKDVDPNNRVLCDFGGYLDE